jgi:hypothetical protein
LCVKECTGSRVCTESRVYLVQGMSECTMATTEVKDGQVTDEQVTDEQVKDGEVKDDETKVKDTDVKVNVRPLFELFAFLRPYMTLPAKELTAQLSLYKHRMYGVPASITTTAGLVIEYSSHQTFTPSWWTGQYDLETIFEFVTQMFIAHAKVPYVKVLNLKMLYAEHLRPWFISGAIISDYVEDAKIRWSDLFGSVESGQVILSCFQSAMTDLIHHPLVNAAYRARFSECDQDQLRFEAL